MISLRPFIIALILGPALPGVVSTLSAQGQGAPGAPTQVRPIEPQEFLRLAHSSALLQGQAAQLASSRQTQPEVKSYAAAAADFRRGFLQRIETFARERNMTLPAVKEFEHQVIIENLEPLDYLALSRRYAEIQLQAIEQELTIYQAASQSSDQGVKSFATQALAELQQQRDRARAIYEAVKP